MKFGVVVFPGSNCDQDMIYVLETILNQEVVKLWHKDKDIKNCDFIILPGGFSYGDYLRSGAIARFSPIMDSIIEHASKGGYVFGVCNGFQILCEAGLLPGALLHNSHYKFSCKNVHIKAENNKTIITSTIDTQKALKVPVAHGEGRYYIDDAGLKDLVNNDQVLFRYCNEQGIVDTSYNPNGAIDNIAGVCNANKNVFGMMPHPERASDIELGNTDGIVLFQSIVNLVES